MLKTYHIYDTTRNSEVELISRQFLSVYASEHFLTDVVATNQEAALRAYNREKGRARSDRSGVRVVYAGQKDACDECGAQGEVFRVGLAFFCEPHLIAAQESFVG